MSGEPVKDVTIRSGVAPCEPNPTTSRDWTTSFAADPIPSEVEIL